MSETERDEIRDLAEKVADIDKRLAVAETQREAHRTETMAALTRIEAASAARSWTPATIAATAAALATVAGTIAAGLSGHTPASPAEASEPPPVEAPQPGPPEPTP